MTDKQKIKELKAEIKELNQVIKDQGEINKYMVAYLIKVSDIIRNRKKR